MPTVHAAAFGDRLPTPIESDHADRLRRIMLKTRHAGGFHFVLQNKEPEEVFLPAELGDLLLDLLRIVAKGQSVRLVPVEAELSTKQAASILNVSRPYLIKLLEQDAIPHRKVGRHRKVRAEDVFAYKAREADNRARIMQEMAEDDQEAGLL